MWIHCWHALLGKRECPNHLEWHPHTWNIGHPKASVGGGGLLWPIKLCVHFFSWKIHLIRSRCHALIFCPHLRIWTLLRAGKLLTRNKTDLFRKTFQNSALSLHGVGARLDLLSERIASGSSQSVQWGTDRQKDRKEDSYAATNLRNDSRLLNLAL